MKPLLCITGPTAVGKSRLALEIAQRLHTDIISADSMQIYKGMDIGTAKPSILEQQQVKHHLIDIVTPNQAYSSNLFARDAEKVISSYSDEKTPLIVGGTGFYFDSLLFPTDFQVSDETFEYRESLKSFLESNGIQALYDLLVERDPVTAERIHPNNTKRVIRALEINHSGVKMSDFSRTKQPKYKFKLFCLTSSDRQTLYDRINARVSNMVADGLIDEVQDLLNEYKDSTLQAFQAIGYKEIIDALLNKSSMTTAIELVKQHTRNYAKRQLTYFKRLDPIYLNAYDSAEVNIEKIMLEYNSIL